MVAYLATTHKSTPFHNAKHYYILYQQMVFFFSALHGCFWLYINSNQRDIIRRPYGMIRSIYQLSSFAIFTTIIWIRTLIQRGSKWGGTYKLDSHINLYTHTHNVNAYIRVYYGTYLILLVCMHTNLNYDYYKQIYCEWYVIGTYYSYLAYPPYVLTVDGLFCCWNCRFYYYHYAGFNNSFSTECNVSLWDNWHITKFRIPTP